MSGRVPALLGAAAIFALSPVFLDLVGHWLVAPWSRYSLVFMPLAGLAIWSGARAEPRALGLALLALAVAASVLLVAGGRSEWARLCIPPAVFGWCLGVGRGDLRAALLSIFAVPVPAVLQKALAPAWPEAFAAGARLPLSIALPELVAHRGAVAFGQAWLAVTPFDGGLTAIVCGTGLALGHGVLRGRRGLDLGRLAVGGAIAGVLAQWMLWEVALLALVSQGDRVARAVLDDGLFVVAIVAALAIAWPRRGVN